MADELKALNDRLSRDWEEMKSALEAREGEVKRLGTALSETTGKLEKIEGALQATESAMTEVKKQVARLDLPPAETTKGGDAELEVKGYRTYLRQGEKAVEAQEFKSLATDTLTQGGYMVPAPPRGDMIRRLIEYSPVRELVTVVTISSGNAWEAPKEGPGDFSAGKVGERSARGKTANADLVMERIPVHEYYANPFVTQTMLDDSAFDVEGWVNERVSKRRSVLEGGYWIGGTGQAEPEGFLTNADIDFVKSGDADEVTDTGLIDLIFDLPAMYARNAKLLWHRKTTAKIRKMKDVTSGQYLWQPGLNGGTSPTVLGYTYVEAIDMPEEGASAYPVLFGDFKAAYKIVDRQDMRVNRDPFSSKPFIEMYTTWRTGGQVVLAEAVRKLKCAT
jgi:HK97 family phage major capsid protein